jgi:hypothetical protein
MERRVKAASSLISSRAVRAITQLLEPRDFRQHCHQRAAGPDPFVVRDAGAKQDFEADRLGQPRLVLPRD